MVSLLSMRVRKSAQPEVKLLGNPESNGFGISKSPPPVLGSTSSDLFDGGADVVLVPSSPWTGGINGGSGWESRAKEVSTKMAGLADELDRRSPCGIAATGTDSDTNNTTIASSESSRDDALDLGQESVMNEDCRAQDVFVPAAAWCDTMASRGAFCQGTGKHRKDVSRKWTASIPVSSPSSTACQPLPIFVVLAAHTVVAQ